LSIHALGRRALTDRRHESPAAPVAPETPASPEAVEFVRFCYRRSEVAWPELYDEMCAVAARCAFRGLDYDELGAFGISFGLADLPRLAAVAHQVVDEERAARPTLAASLGRSPA
jgi:hypothetical protein